MARQLTSIIAEMSEQIRRIASQRDAALNANINLCEQVDTLTQKLSESEDELDMLRMEVEFLTLSHRLADDPDHLVAARRRIKRMIAKIDRCVALLKGDADII